MKLFFDGGYDRGGMTIAVVVRGEVVAERVAGPGGSMTAEWLALIRAAAVAAERGVADAVLVGDAAAVIAQARGEVRCPPTHLEHRAAFLVAVARLPRWRLRWVRRGQNLAGIALARYSARIAMPDDAPPPA